MEKDYWRNMWLSSINELTSTELQKVSWLDESNSNPHWSFIEFMSCYFDDLGINDNYEKVLNQKWVSKDEFSIIKEWHIKLDNYKPPNNEPYNVIEILKDENWLQILAEGESVKRKLRYILNETEVRILDDKINYFKYIKLKKQNES